MEKRCYALRRRHQHSPLGVSTSRRRVRSALSAGSREPAPIAQRIDTPQRYELVERLGAGGTAELYLATRRGAHGFRRTVIVKRMHRTLSGDGRLTEMFIREALVSARLSHPNIVSVLDFDRDRDGQLFLVLELVEGVDLNKLLASGPLPVVVTVFIVGEILRGLSYLDDLPADGGSNGIVHRDLSPHNILLSWDGAVKIADLGLADFLRASHASASRDLYSKATFKLPEQINRWPLDGRSDLFSVGVMLLEMLAGERLFRYGGANGEAWRVLDLSIVRPGLVCPTASELDAVAMRLLARDPTGRFPDADAAFDALAAFYDSGRGRLELERLLRERFPRESPSGARSPSPMPSPAPSGGVTQFARSHAWSFNRHSVPARLWHWIRQRWPRIAAVAASSVPTL